MTLASEAGKDGGVASEQSRFSLVGSATVLGIPTSSSRHAGTEGTEKRATFVTSVSARQVPGTGGALSRTGKTNVKAPGVRDFPGLSTT